MTELAFLRLLAYTWIGVAAVTFAALLFITAPYGRHNRGGFGPQMDATLGWIVMEAPAPLLMVVFFLLAPPTVWASPALVFLLLWLLHYLQRTFVWPLRRRQWATTLPVFIAATAVLFNGVNAYLNGRWLFNLVPVYPWSWVADPRFLIGVAVFLAGFAINLHADEVLLRLKRAGAGYQIPRGGLYRWVSCPNYLGEMLEWTGWALATWSLPGLVFAVWTAANLAPRALSNHRWYREKFADYPAERRAFIPFVL
jgi:protein-S-isoprenylcysteine O-methyltransferase Ste14